MKCLRCQAEDPPGTRFCGQCAAPLASVCSSCGASNAPENKFCGQCAATLDKPAPPRFAAPESYTPKHLAERILTSKSAFEGERKQVTVLFADLKGSMELLADRDPEDARKLLDPVLEHMMEAVHRYEGTVNQVMGDGIMALFGAPLALEDHAVRACYAALDMQSAIRRYAEEVRRAHGAKVQIRVGLNSGEVIVRAIGSDLHMDYTAVGQTTHLAARMEQLADPGSTLLTANTLRLAEGYVEVKPLGPVPVKGLVALVEVYELARAGAPPSRLHAAAARGLTRFVGRDTELEQLRQALGRAATGRGQVAAIVGEAGVGKSRLVWEVTHSHRTHGWLILQASSASFGRASPYLPVIGLFTSYFRIEGRDDPRAIREKVMGKLLALDRALEPALPALLALLGVQVDDVAWQALDPRQRRERTVEAAKRLLLCESRVQPLLVAFEDLHWIDSETQGLLDSLVESVPTARLLLLVNYRPEYEHRWAGKTYYTQLRLDPLPPESAEELLRALMGEDPALTPLARRLVERTEGNPFFLEESVRSLGETGALGGGRGRHRLALPLPEIRVPATVQAVLAARMDRLPVEERQLLQEAAVIGKDVSLALLRAVTELPEDHLRRRLAHLQAGEFLYETSLYPDPEYTFKHALTQEVAYNGLLQERRRALHTRVLEALERDTGDGVHEHVERLAHHAVRAERWDRAAAYLHQAGEKVFAYGAHASAVPFYEAAIDAVDRQGERGDRTLKLDACLELWAVKMETGQLRGLRKLAATSESLAISLGDRPRLAKVRLSQAQMLWVLPADAGAFDAAIEHAREAASLAEPADLRTRSWAQFVAGAILSDVGDFPGSIQVYDRGAALFEGVELPPAVQGFVRPINASLCSWRAESLGALGEFDRAVASGEEGRGLADEIGQPSIRALARGCLGRVHLMRGDIDRSLTLLDAGLGIAEESGAVFGILTNALLLAFARALLGERGAAESHLERVRQVSASLGAVMTKFTPYGILVTAPLLALDRVDEARTEAEAGLALAAARGARGHKPTLLRLRAEILGRQAPDNAGEAIRCCEQALALAERLGMRPEMAHCHAGLAKLYRRIGQHEQTQERLTTATTLYREMGMTYWRERVEAEMKEMA